MIRNSQPSPLILNGIDGGNPLGFLAALGTAILGKTLHPDTRFYWCPREGVWRPALLGCGTEQKLFIEQLLSAIKGASMSPFEINDKLPFQVELFETSLKQAQQTASLDNRRMADFLVAFGSEINPENGVFRDSRFRMVRSGDSKGQGLPAYARAIRNATDGAALERTLFTRWDYSDDAFSLRWDPIEDRRYALGWRDPSKSSLKGTARTMIGANSLAIEALQFYPTVFQAGRSVTTGFHRSLDKEWWFSWPIWNCPISLDTVRSLLALPNLHKEQPPRSKLAKLGIVEVYRSQRIQQNQYYSNFTSGKPG